MLCQQASPRALALAAVILLLVGCNRLKEYCETHSLAFCSPSVDEIRKKRQKRDEPKKPDPPPPSPTDSPNDASSQQIDLGILASTTTSEEDKLDFLDRLSFELASKVAKDPSQRDALLPVAGQSLTAVRELEKSLRERRPKVREEFSTQISETLLDLQYTLSSSSPFSFRLNRRVLGPLGKTK